MTRQNCSFPRSQELILDILGSRIVLLIAFFLPSLAAAQGIEEQGIEGIGEVIVTAQRRAEAIQDIGIAVTAFSSEKLAESGITNSDELFLRVPSVELQQINGASQTNIFIRGIGDTGPAINQVSPIGIYSDEVSLNSPAVNVLQLYDMERVEVLRGPQNTLYGRNTTGGAVNFISTRPEIGQELDGYANLSYGSYDQIDGEGAVGFSIGDKAAGRLAFQVQTRDGVYDNVVQGTDSYTREKYAGRAQLLFEPADDLSVLMKVHAEDVDQINKQWKAIGLRDPNDPDALVNPLTTSVVVTENCPFEIRLGSGCVDALGFADNDDNTQVGGVLPDPIESIEAFGGAVTINWRLRHFDVTSISAFESNDYRKVFEGAASIAPVFDLFQVSDQEQWSQEVRLTSPGDRDLRWIAGAYAFQENLVGDTVPVFHSINNVAATRLDQKDTVYSAYTDFQYDVTDRLTAIVGGRYTYEKVEGVNDTRATSLLIPVVAARILPTHGQSPLSLDDLIGLPGLAIRLPYEMSWEEWGGKVGLEFQSTDDVLLYAHVARGFKAGNFSNAPLQTIAGNFEPPTDPEILVSYEGGAKATLLDNTLQANLSVYYYDFKDQQQLVVADSALGPVATRINIDGSKLLGAEWDIVWVPGNGWQLGIVGGWLDTEYEEFINAVGLNIEGNKLVYTPEWTLTADVRKEWPVNLGGIFSDAILSLGGDVHYASKRYFDISNDPLLTDGSYYTVDLQAGLEFGSEQQHRLSVWGKNVTDEQWVVHMVEFSIRGLLPTLLSDPATFGVTLSTRF